MLSTQALPNFDEVAGEMLALLQKRLAFDLWMITRVEGNNWIVLYARGEGYSVCEGDVFHWPDSYCYRMVNHDAPRIIPDCAANTAYAQAPINESLPIGAYVGIPLTYSDGQLFGTLCAVHPQPMSQDITAELPLLEVLANMLGLILSVCLDVSGQARHKEQGEADRLRDDETGLYNRCGWDYLLSREEQRCRLYGHSACIISVQIHGSCDQMGRDRSGASAEDIVKLAQIIQSTARKDDIVARVGERTFAILVVESTLSDGKIFLERLQLYLRLAQLKTTTAIATRDRDQYRLTTVWQQAQAATGAYP